MGQRLGPEHLELYKKIDQILWNDGCPLGCTGTPEDRDEYFHYLPRVFRMAREGASCGDIADYLRTIAQRTQGHPFDAPRCAALASSIVQERNMRGF